MIHIQTFFLLLSLLTAVGCSSLLCDACFSLLGIVQSIIVSDPVMFVTRQVYLRACPYSPEICAQVFDNNNYIHVSGVARHFSPSVMCPKYGFCASPRVVKSPLKDYQRRILRDKPPRQYPVVTDSGAKPFSFAVVTDLHVDLNYTQERSTRCNSPVCCRNDSPVLVDQEHRPGKWGHQGTCDLPLRTAENFVDDVKMGHPDVKFILWLGDNPADVYYAMDKRNQAMVYEKLTHKLLERFPNVGDVYPVTGNHEGIPRDHVDPHEGADTWPIPFLADLWSPWLTPESRVTMRKYGRYTQLHPGTKLRIVALNNFVESSKNTFMWDNSTDIWGELAWLEETLAAAERNGESVMIIGHYPPRCSFKIDAWNERYLVLVDRYANIIRGQMVGHTHEDSFEVERSTRKGEFIGVAMENPSLTSNNYLSPSYRIYKMDPGNYALLDYEQYRFNLTKANRDDQPEWQLSYTFKQYYGLQGMTDRDFASLARRIKTDDATYKKYALMRYAEGPRSVVMMHDLTRKNETFCEITSATNTQYDQCMGKTEFTLTRIYPQIMVLDWEYAIYD